MSVPHLSVVKIEENDTPAERARRLYAEAQAAAFEQVDQLEASLDTVVRLSQAISEGGDIYPSGIRELSRRMAEDAKARRQTLEALAARR